MYDTINLWLPTDKVGSFNPSKILQPLSNITEHIRDDGQVFASGYLKNYKVTISEKRLSLKPI